MITQEDLQANFLPVYCNTNLRMKIFQILYKFIIYLYKCNRFSNKPSSSLIRLAVKTEAAAIKSPSTGALDGIITLYLNWKVIIIILDKYHDWYVRTLEYITVNNSNIKDEPRAAAPFCAFLQAKMTLAPLRAKSIAVSFPTPAFAPVTMTVLPCKLLVLFHTPVVTLRYSLRSSRSASEMVVVWTSRGSPRKNLASILTTET